MTPTPHTIPDLTGATTKPAPRPAKLDDERSPEAQRLSGIICHGAWDLAEAAAQTEVTEMRAQARTVANRILAAIGPEA